MSTLTGEMCLDRARIVPSKSLAVTKLYNCPSMHQGTHTLRQTAEASQVRVVGQRTWNVDQSKESERLREKLDFPQTLRLLDGL